MEKVFDSQLMNSYIEKYNLNEILNQEVLKSVELFKYSKGEAICNDGDIIDSLYFLMKGKLKICTTLENGRTILIRFYNPLSMVGDMELLTDFRVKFDVEAIKESYLIGIKFRDIKESAYDDSKFLRFIIKHLSHKLYTNSNSNTINILYPVENRFASYLVSIFLDENNSINIEEIKTSKLSEIAELLGTSYRHLNRVISKLILEGTIMKRNGAILIKDIDRLKELARGNLYG